MVFLLVHELLLACALLWAVTPTVSDTCTNYRGSPGVPGIPGAHGANGKDGPKGEKGDPGADTQPVQGPKGDQGFPGYPGRPGLKGDEGMPGPPGPKGQKGQKGAPAGITKDEPSFFSYKRSQIRLRPLQKTVEFDVPFIPGSDTLSSGFFEAKYDGIYFFVYHISATNTVCLYFKKQEEVLLKLCDMSKAVLVTSGSIVVNLKKGEKVQVYTPNLREIIKDADSTFTGFLLFRS